MTQDQTPSLRFPEFQGAGAWEMNNLENLTYFVNKKISLDLLTSSNFVSTENILPDYKGVKPASKLPSSGSANKFQINDILISNIRPYLKKVWFSNKEGGASNDIIVIRAKEKVSALYLSFILKNDVFIDYVMKGAKGVKMPRGDVSLIRKYLLMYPSPAEQDKITECLLSLDEVITAQGDRLDGLKDYKRGLMQQLFPADGQTIPTLRFPEFQGKDPWQEKRLAEVCSKIPQGGTPDTTKPDYWNGSINWLTPAEMGKTKDRFMHTTVRKITKLGLKKCSSDLLPINSIIVSTRAPIGYLTINKTKMAFNQGCKGLVPNKTTSYDFLYYTLLFYKNSLIALGSGSTFKELTGNSLKNFKVTFPSLEEQKKIADCLSVMDELITVQEEKIKTLKHHKNGLMQQLFPKL